MNIKLKITFGTVFTDECPLELTFEEAKELLRRTQ